MNRIKALIERVRSIRGFTFVELLISVLISFIILGAIFEVFIAQRRRYVTEDAMLEVENRGDFAIEYLTRTIQNSGFNTKQGMKFETASDHYFTTLMDEDDDGVIAPGEVVTISLNKPYREIAATEQPTGLVHDPDMDDFTGGKRQFSFDIYFDMNGDDTVADAEKFTSGYNLNTARDDNSLDQKDAIRLYLTGPPYAIYRYSYRLLDEGSAYSAGNPYIVNPQPDLVADNVDNLIIRYYDEEDLPLPVTYDNNGNRVSPSPPYILTREDMAKIRRVEFELLLRTARKDAKWTDNGSYPVGSVATYGGDGRPVGWSCGDPDFRANEPYLTNCSTLSDWDCFIKYCNFKEYPTVSGGEVTYQDNYRRLLLTSSVTPKNLVLNPYGSLTIVSNPTKILCPDTETTLTATLKDREGDPIANAVVNFYATSLVSAIDVSGASTKDGDGNPITDANGVVTGIILRPTTPPTVGKRQPSTVTVSADSKITVNVAGVDKSFPVYSSIVVPFVVGPPVLIDIVNPATSVSACNASFRQEFTIYAEDCNEFAVEGATIRMSLVDSGDPTAAFPPPGVDPGKFVIYDDDSSAWVENGKVAVDYSDSIDDMGKYHIYYQPPTVQTPYTTYIRSLYLLATAEEFEDKILDDPEPGGWGFPSKPFNDPLGSDALAIEPGPLNTLVADPVSYSGAGCKNNSLPISVVGYDCGALPLADDSYPLRSSVIPADVPSPPPIIGTLTDLLGGILGPDNIQMIWDDTHSTYKIIFLNTGCAITVLDERVQILNYDKTQTPPASPVGRDVALNLTECPVGMNITMRAREPHTTTPVGDGTLTDGFYQNGCNYDNLDVEALVILNLPPTVLCDNIVGNPVTFTVVSGGARFLDAGENPTLTTLTSNTDSNGRALAPLKLTSTSLADVVIRAESTSGSYSATGEITLPVGPDEIVFAYRDQCYSDRITPANALRTGDNVYVEVRDCTRNDNVGSVDTTSARAYEWIGSFADTELFTLTETGNNTGIFRGKIRTRALPMGWAATADDGILDLTNAGYFNINYEDEVGNIFRLYEAPGPYVMTILDRCDEGIKFMEVFNNTSYDGLTSDMTNFPLTTSASWRAFSSLNITHNTSPSLSPSADTVKKLMLQFCDELYLSGAVFFKHIWSAGAVSFPPLTSPDELWRKGETLMWVDLDESVVGSSGSEKDWTDLVVSYRFKYMGSPDDIGYGGGSTVTLPDYYLPGVDKGVCFFFRAATSTKTLTSLSGSPTMDLIDRGYIAVWTKDGSGNPVAKLFRIDGVDESDDPLVMDVTQVGGDVTSVFTPTFTMQYDDPGYHRVEISLGGDEFNIYFDDVFMDFDGAGGSSYIGGSSVIDRNYVDGTVGFGVKDVIAKFDNVQVCGSPPMKIITSNPYFPQGTPVTLTMVDSIYEINTEGPVSWEVTPSSSGTFSENPSPTAAVIFTRGWFAAFPEQFDAIDALGRIANFLTTQPPATCQTQSFESYANGATPTDFASCVGTWQVNTDSSTGSKGIRYNGTVGTTIRLLRASATAYQTIWTNNLYDYYDDYTVEIDVRANDSATVAGLTFRNSNTSCGAYYYLSIGRVSTSNNRLRVNLVYHPSSGGEQTLSTFTHATDNFRTTTPVYHLIVTVNGSTITYSVERPGGTVLDSGSVTDTRLKTGGPGFRLYGNNAYFDNFSICTLP